MEIIRIGNWSISEEGIQWSGDTKLNYFIAKEELTQAGVGDRISTIDCLVHMVEKPLTPEDIYALNTALVYSLQYFGIDLPAGISFVKTFEEQNKRINRIYPDFIINSMREDIESDES